MLGDFNTILHKEDRYGGNDVIDSEVRELSTLMEDCELQEMASIEPYYSWTNKNIWSRIDHVLINSLWHDTFNYTIAKYLTSGLSDHSLILMYFPDTSLPKPQFQFSDMWIKHYHFHSIIALAVPTKPLLPNCRD